MIRTKEGAYTFEHSLNHALEFFSKAGSQFTKKMSYYGVGNEETALSLFQKSWIVDKELTMRLLLWLRDCRGGAGNRSATRDILHWLAKNDPQWIMANIGWIPLVGRWDDLMSLFGTELETVAAQLWAGAIAKSDVLAAKWADRSYKPLQKALKKNEAELRKLLSKIRKEHIVEFKMCATDWERIIYEHVPSVAMARYTKAFGRHDDERFQAYKEALLAGKTTVKASVLFPHDCIRTVKHGDKAIADAQFDALPNYMEGTNEKIIVISDTSGSMSTIVAGSIQAMDVSQGLALYCSAKIPKDNPFHKRFIGFESESKFKVWEGMTFSQAVRSRDVFDGACGGTRIDKALDLILKTAVFYKLTNEHMPTMLLIVSDMQFHQGAGSFRWASTEKERKDIEQKPLTEIEACLQKWDKAGYNRPKVVYWNTSAYAGSQATVNDKNVAMVSGFSPSVLKALLSGEDFSPIAVMMKALEKYKVVVP